jgi:putative flippase GtrA
VVAQQFLRFAAVGTIGFLADSSVLYLALHYFDAGLYVGRLLSYLAAATITWALNRRYTFRPYRSSALLTEWTRYLGANAFGGICNYGAYVALVVTLKTVATHPVLGVAAGSVVGLSINFCLSRHLVFRVRQTMSQRTADRACNPPRQ